jgi:hypothetical protein
MRDQEFSFTRYLAAKRSIDDRSLNRHVWDSLRNMLAQNPSSEPVRVLELGAGIGTMLHRVVEWQLTPSDMIYTAVDQHTEFLAKLWSDLPGWADQHAIEVEQQAENSARLALPGGQTIHLMTERADINTLPAINTGRDPVNLLMAHAVLDLLNIPQILPGLLSLIKPDGLCYFTLTFDSLTLFEPIIDSVLDSQIETLYHQTMDQRRVDGASSGDSQSGRHLLNLLIESDISVLAAGASDWVVMPVQGQYQADDAYFLRCILRMITDALTDQTALDKTIFADWINRRHQQIDQRKLIYIAHQIDVCGQI